MAQYSLSIHPVCANIDRAKFPPSPFKNISVIVIFWLPENNNNKLYQFCDSYSGFVTRLTWRVPLEQELLTLPEHLGSPPVFSGVHATRSVVFLCMLCRSLFVFYPYYFGHCVVCPSLIYGFWLPLWYLYGFWLPLWYLYGFWLPLWYLYGFWLPLWYLYGFWLPLWYLYGFWLPLWYLYGFWLPLWYLYGFWLPLWYLYGFCLQSQ